MIYWLLLTASILHVAEESIFDFVGFVRVHSPVKGVTQGQFVVVNTLFLALMLSAALLGERHAVLFKLNILFCQVLPVPANERNHGETGQRKDRPYKEKLLNRDECDQD